MGLLQAGYRTYTAHEKRAGIIEDGRQALTPVSHTVKNADIEITINSKGEFRSAAALDKKDIKTIIPATLKSANRTGDTVVPHPLCETLQYLSPHDEARFEAYVLQLKSWAQSEFSHPRLRAVLQYIQGETILNDLLVAGLIKPDGDGGLAKYAKKFIRWRVIGSGDGTRDACYEDLTLFESFIGYYEKQCAGLERDICLLTGREDLLCEMHPKGVVASSGNAKLLSANDESGFTYRGRFKNGREAYNVGYESSQKAHNALRWVAANEGVYFGGRTFLCWNPEGKRVPSQELLRGFSPADEPPTFISYRDELQKMLNGYRQELENIDDVIIASLDAATTGRLAVTYYGELKASDFLERLESWYTGCCWDTGRQVLSPAPKRIIDCAFGTQRSAFIETDGKVLREHIQRLVSCILNKGRIPQDIVRALVTKAGNLLPYTPNNRQFMLVTACAIVRKYKNDIAQKEEWTLALDTSCTDRSYLFGRLLAVAEQVERATYDREEGREPNAIRLQAAFVQRPMHTWKNIEEKLLPYFARLSPGIRAYYKDIIGEIVEKLPPLDDPELGRMLSDTYLLGYYLQRTALFTKKDKNSGEENENESAE